MYNTGHEIILSYMKLSENVNQVGYPLLHEALELSWYEIFKKTKESLVKKWYPVVNGKVKYPKSLEKLMGIYVVDNCGYLAWLSEDDTKNIIPQPAAKCSCNVCDHSECMCPSIMDIPNQVDVVIEGTTYTNKTVTKVLKNGNVVEEKYIWVPAYDTNGEFTDVQEVPSQTTICKVDVKPCGCVVHNEENAAKLLRCGCLTDICVPALRDRYPALYNEFGYYKKDEDNREVNIFSSEGKVSTLKYVLFVFQSNGSDILVPKYAKKCLIALLDYTKKQYSLSFTDRDRDSSYRNYKREKRRMVEYLNPIPYEWIIEVGNGHVSNYPYYRKPHSDFVQPEIVKVCNTAATVPDNITNITYVTIPTGGRYLKEIAGGGKSTSPIVGTKTYTDLRLQGLGNNNDDQVEIIVNTQEMQNWGQAASFTFDKVLGKITFTDYEWLQGDSLKVDLMQ